jgi:hypothetical protein
MKDYWSCSKFADWLRGTPKPTAETSTGWRDWTISAKMRHPFRYWISNEVLDYIQWVIYSPSELLYSIKYYINKFNGIKQSPDFKFKSDGQKSESVELFLTVCQKAIEVADKMLLLYPDANDDNNKL